MTEQEKIDAGLIWNDSPEILEEQRIAKEMLYDFNMSRPSENDLRNQIIKKMFNVCGENVWINQPLTLCRGKTISIGHDCYFNSGTTFVDDAKVTIENYVMFGPNVTICTTGHPLSPEHRFDGMYSFPINIKDNVWIGAGAIVLAGVTIGENTVIGAGSVVTKDIPANVIAVGSPCKVMRELNDHDKEFYFRDHKLVNT